jgi:hypothetical protein|tara:strand:- start:12949 stop:13545 length:597 start_codon:yes stop_codon:yes gene_type:complete
MHIKIVDNFLESSDLELLVEFINKSRRVDKNGLNINKIEDSELVKKLNSAYHIKVMNILQQLFPQKVELYDYTQFALIETGSNFKFPIHDDDPNKILSGVVYIQPQKNIGTKFYSNKKGDVLEIVEWKINRAVFFSRKERKSWHSYEGDGKQNRIALVYNLMTKNIKKVYEIENKNYFLGLLRWKINPYLYRFFKIII